MPLHASVYVEHAVILLVAVIGAIAPTIAAVATLRQSQRTGVKVADIHVMTNGQLTALRQELAEAQAMIRELQAKLDHG